jgi:hypothetical protein
MQRPAAACLGLLALLSTPRLASADTFAIRARPEGLHQLSQLAPVVVPRTLNLPDFEETLLDCPSDLDIVAVTRDGVATIDWHRVEVDVRDQELRVDALLDLEASAELRVKRAFGCIGSLVCDVNASAAQLGIAITLRTEPSTNGTMKLDTAEVDLQVEPDEFHVNVANCDITDVLATFGEASDAWLSKQVIAQAERVAAEQIQHLLQGNMPLHLEAGGFTADAKLEQCFISERTGVTVIGEADVKWYGTDGGGTPATKKPIGLPFPDDFGPGNFAVAASDALATRALYQAWRGGILEGVIDDLLPTIEISEDGLAQRLGLQAGTQIELDVELAHPAVVEFGRDGPGAKLEVEELLAHVTISSPDLPPWYLEVALDGHIMATPKVDTALGALVLVPTDLGIERLNIRNNAGSLVTDRLRMSEFLRAVVVPLLGQQLAEMPLAPAIEPIDGIYLWLRNLEADAGWLRGSTDLFVVDPNDNTPPDTHLIRSFTPPTSRRSTAITCSRWRRST